MAEIDTKRAFENGKRAAQLDGIQDSLDEIKGALTSLSGKLDAQILVGAGIRTQLKVLWAAAGLYGVTIIGLALKVLLGAK